MLKITSEVFFQRCHIKHNNKYDYSLCQYQLLSDKLTISCPTHGPFIQQASNHLYGRGCYYCGREATGLKNKVKYSKDNTWFIARAQKTHGDRYDYSNITYLNGKSKINIACTTHGPFVQLAEDHLKGAGCPRCAKAGRSRGQDLWLDSLGIPSDQAHRNVRVNLSNSKWLRADGFLNNTFYEFWGDWAHGNPDIYKPEDMNLKYKKTFGQLFDETQIKRNLIISSGYQLIEIWESEWRKSLA